MKALLLSLAIFASPLFAGELDLKYETFTLPNGLVVMLHQDKSVAGATVNVWYHVGSANESPGRTGFAHLFEHIMFEGSKNVPEGAFDVWLEKAGGYSNGSTTEDRTNYWENMPPSAVELALFLEADRMGYLLDTMTEASVNGQRDVVKNERRQSYENRPYGVAWLAMPALLYPKTHPYSWTVIGSMEDLSAASQQDVRGFHKRYYTPNNASLVVAGNIDLVKTKAQVIKWFSGIARGPAIERPKAQPAILAENKSVVLQDRVEQERAMLTWPTVPLYSDDDAALDVLAEILGSGKNARLQKRLIHDDKIAFQVGVWHSSQALTGALTIDVMAVSGQKIDRLIKSALGEVDRVIKSGVSERELQRVKNQLQTKFYDDFERIGGFSGRADRMNGYHFAGKPADWFAQDLARYRALTTADIQRVAQKYLTKPRLDIIVVPKAER